MSLRRISSSQIKIVSTSVLLISLVSLIIYLRGSYSNLSRIVNAGGNDFISLSKLNENKSDHRILLANEVVDRHEKNPRENDLDSDKKISNENDSRTLCDKKENGLHGQSSTNRVDIRYSYEIEILASSFKKVLSEVIPAIEIGINDSLVHSFLPICPNNGKRYRTRSLRSQNIVNTGSKDDRARSLEVQGITSKPIDINDISLVCENLQTTENTKCGHIMGNLSLFLNEDLNLDDVEVTTGQVIFLVEENFQGGAYVSEFDEIKGISFLKDELEIISYGNGRDTSIGDDGQDSGIEEDGQGTSMEEDGQSTSIEEERESMPSFTVFSVMATLIIFGVFLSLIHVKIHEINVED